LLDTLIRFGDNSEVALFSPDWGQIAYFLNPFEQGDLFHPGLMYLAQDFFDQSNVKTDLRSLVTHSSTSVFSNFIVAKPRFWQQWLVIADRFFDFVENEAPDRFRETTDYGSSEFQAPMKTFIQERIPSVLLAQGDFKVLSIDQSPFAPIFTMLFDDDAQTRRMLQVCDFLKKEYSLSKDDDYLKMYWTIRRKIPFHGT
jgi:hypothetical protein